MLIFVYHKMKGVTIMQEIHKGGRPHKYNDSFYLAILKEYENNSYAMIAKNHKVSKDTAIRWVKKGRELMADER